MSEDPRQEYFADGIVDDVITELSRFSVVRDCSQLHLPIQGQAAINFRQMGSELGVRYVLEGSVRRGGWLRIAAQLIDAETGGHRWADRTTRPRDVFAVQDE